MNGIFGCNSCSWVLILVIIFLLSQNSGCDNAGSCGCGGNSCGCENNYNAVGNGCGCGCN